MVFIVVHVSKSKNPYAAREDGNYEYVRTEKTWEGAMRSAYSILCDRSYYHVDEKGGKIDLDGEAPVLDAPSEVSPHSKMWKVAWEKAHPERGVFIFEVAAPCTEASVRKVTTEDEIKDIVMKGVYPTLVENRPSEIDFYAFHDENEEVSPDVKVYVTGVSFKLRSEDHADPDVSGIFDTSRFNVDFVDVTRDGVNVDIDWVLSQSVE